MQFSPLFFFLRPPYGTSSFLLASIALLLASCQNLPSHIAQNQANSSLPVDLCLHNAIIYTGTPQQTMPLHGEVLIQDGKIVSVLQTSHTFNPTQMCAHAKRHIDMKMAAIYPGFVDAHAHFLGIGMREITLNLEEVTSIAHLQEKLSTAVRDLPKGSVVYGRGWIETHWPEGRFPNRQDLDAVAKDYVVILERADGHAVVASSRALAKANITHTTKPPFGGEFLKSADGQPTGMLIDNATLLVDALRAAPSEARKRNAYQQANNVYARFGWTGAHSMSVEAQNIPLMEEMANNGEISLRIYNAFDVKNAETLWESIADTHAKGHIHTNKNGLIETRAIKLYADGALGSRGAALNAPYSDAPDKQGLLLTTREKIMPILERALRDGLQVCTHAIGDKANRLVLDWYEEAYKLVPISERASSKHHAQSPRWRIEHSQIIDPTDIPRFHELDVIASMQPSHAIGDLHFAPSRLGKNRLNGAYAWRDLLNANVHIAAGSDAPVEKGDPRIEFYAFITRQDLNGFSNEDWHAEQKLTRQEALYMLTMAPAYASFREHELGTIEVGKYADMTIMGADIMQIAPQDILTTPVIMTLVNGRIVYADPQYTAK